MTTPAVVLVGLPGSGKSATAQLLAQRWSVPVVDTSEVAAAHLGASVTELFAGSHTEQQFHEEETTVALSALQRAGVVALGSSVVSAPSVRAALAGLRVVWLQASVVTITRRLGLPRFGPDVLAAARAQLDAQLAERATWYSGVATEQIDTDRLTLAQVAEQLIAQGETK